ncbi:MAG: response regulator [Rhodospirillaceae bacterium]|jgi:two-component system, chemotaxis family, response regulator Rcp1|nr:response regulator [Rhodospirillaceae bacterium]MBT5456830.1 response regulator [Rhodospirillaceae bacterium]
MNDDTGKCVEILLVEDNEGDVFLTKRAFEKAGIVNNISVAPNGEIALEMLRGQEGYGDVPRPDLVLLDVNLPKKDGKQVLSELKSDENLRRIPVIMLTSSNAQQDITSAYDLHASGYILKPSNIENFHRVVSAIENFWFRAVVMPSAV